MAVKIFNPKEVEVGNIGPMMIKKVKNLKLQAFLKKKSEEDGNLSAIVVGDSENMGLGVGTWTPENTMKNPVPVVFDEVPTINFLRVNDKAEMKKKARLMSMVVRGLLVLVVLIGVVLLWWLGLGTK